MKIFLKNPLYPLQEKSLLARYTLALLPSICVVSVYDFLPLFLQSTPVALQYLPVFLACWLGGIIPGLISISISLHFIIFKVNPLLINSLVNTPSGIVRVGVFLTTTLVTLTMFFTMRKALQKANDAVALRDDFLNLASHELRTPLTALRLNLNVAQKIMNDENAEAAAKFLLESSNRQVTRLERLIVAMMDLTLFDSDQLILLKNKCDLKKIVSEIVSSLDNSTITIDAPDSEYIGHWDQIRIEQVVSNILHNALKYGQGKPILVTLGKAENQIWFSVKDQGPGIDMKDHIRVFERFQRVNVSTNVHGLGLGLFLTKMLVNIHDGEVSLESMPGSGALFTVKLPA